MYQFIAAFFNDSFIASQLLKVGVGTGHVVAHDSMEPSMQKPPFAWSSEGSFSFQLMPQPNL